MPSNLIFGLPNLTSLVIALGVVGLVLIVYALTVASRSSLVHPRLRAAAGSGWLPVLILAGFATVLLAAYGTSIRDSAFFAGYVTLGLAIPGMLWVRLLRGRAAHVSEDLAMGLAAGYCIEIATYAVARAVGFPQLFLLWPVSTLIVFSAAPGLRRYWRGEAARAPIWWSWSLAAILGYLLIYSAGTFFASHHLTGTDAPYVDMPFHLALIGELVFHVPPQIPYVSGVPLAYHWFYYADAAATSWATGIDPVALLYRLSGLPMFVAFVLLTAAGAQRLIEHKASGPIAVAIALFGTAAGAYGWLSGSPVYATQTLGTTWISPTNLFGLAIFAAVTLAFMDLLRDRTSLPRRHWLLVGLLVVGAAGAKASLLPLLIAGLLVVVVGMALTDRRLHRTAAVGLAMAVVVFALAAALLYRGSAPGLVIGIKSLTLNPVVNFPGAQGAALVALAAAALGVSVLLWLFMWGGALGLIARWRTYLTDARVLLLVGIGAAGLGAVTVMSYPGLSQSYYLSAAAGAIGIFVTAGLAGVVPSRTRYLPMAVCVAVAIVAGAVVVSIVRALGPDAPPSIATNHLATILVKVALPVVALAGVAVLAYVALRYAAARVPLLQGAVPLLVIALMMGFSLPSSGTLLASPITNSPIAGTAIPGDGIGAARWLRDHSGPSDLVATNLHCDTYLTNYDSCNPVSFWVSAYSERHVLVEGWAYTIDSVKLPNNQVAPFWDPARLAANDTAFTHPSAAAETTLRTVYGVQWLLADLTGADPGALRTYADLKYRQGDFAVYRLR